MPRRPAQATPTKPASHSTTVAPQHLHIVAPPPWDAYELIDSGDGRKLERFGQYRLVRPETQAIWSPACSAAEWDRADAHFKSARGDESTPGEWVQPRSLPEHWSIRYHNLAFLVRLTPFRHTGVFPEHGAHWVWMQQQLQGCTPQPSVLVLFGYTGLHTLIAAQAGARVCHVDASRPATRWARENQAASRLEDRPIRWIVDDVTRFVRREVRREARYDMIVLDPPVFGRGPKGEVWRIHEALPSLIVLCRQLLSDQPVGVLLHAYATNLSAVTLYNLLEGAMRPYGGSVDAGELVLQETSAGRRLPAALYARWSKR
jgi:23S rRNA (cytosine1962-C5)-methyltransferase